MKKNILIFCVSLSIFTFMAVGDESSAQTASLEPVEVPISKLVPNAVNINDAESMNSLLNDPTLASSPQLNPNTNTSLIPNPKIEDLRSVIPNPVDIHDNEGLETLLNDSTLKHSRQMNFSDNFGLSGQAAESEINTKGQTFRDVSDNTMNDVTDVNKAISQEENAELEASNQLSENNNSLVSEQVEGSGLPTNCP